MIANVKEIDNNNSNSQNIFPILLLNGLVIVTNNRLLLGSSDLSYFVHI